jgi:hypothetical protein
MALPILDGNQSATTLSTILSSGQHITAHTVVSLGTQAITDIVNATSAGLTNTQLRASAVTVGGTVTVGNSVTISSLPAISGTVTANVGGIASGVTVPVRLYAEQISGPESGQDTLVVCDSVGQLLVNATVAGSSVLGYDGYAYVSVKPSVGSSVTIGNSVTIGSLPAISGTVTANVFGQNQTNFFQEPIPVDNYTNTRANAENDLIVPVQITNDSGTLNASNPLPISGTVTANTFALQGTAVTTSNFTSTTASTVLASFNATREVLTIFNEGAGNLHICAGATCTTIAYQVRLSAGDYYEVPNHQTSLTHSAVFATAGTARVTQVS